MSDQTTALKISADASGVEAGVSTAKRSLATLGAAAKSVGETVGKGMAPIGDGADGAAKKVDNATKSIIGSIQRTTALMEAGERGSAKYYEALGAQRGVSVDALKPYIAQLEAVKEKQAQASAALAGGSTSLGKVEMSARATSAALRGVPAQFTDIITSLQGGQAPMTVLLQQGGQLKDMFGGAGNAAKALGGYVVGLVNPFTVTAAVVGTLAIAYNKGAEEARAFQNAATLTGGAVGVSNTQFAAMAQSISSIAGTRGKASEVLTEIASTGKLAGSEIKGIAEAAILMEKATGQAVSKTVAEFVKLSDEPAKASIELNKQYHYLTTSVYEQIKALEDQGKKTQAAELAERSYADALKTRALSVVENAGLMEKAWRGITGAAKGAWDAMNDVGRDATIGDKLADQERVVSQLERPGATMRKGLNLTAPVQDKDIAAARELLASLRETVRLEQRSTEATAERARIQAAGTAAVDAVAKANERAASKQEQLNKALREYRDNIAAIRAANPQSALLDPKTIAAAEAGIRDQFKGAKAPAAAKPDAFMSDVARVYTKALDDLDKVQISASASADKLSKTQEILRGVQASPEWATFNMRKQEEVIMAASLSQAEEDRRAALDASKKAQDAYNASARESANSIANKLEALGDETRAYAIATAKNISLAEAIDLVAIARLEEEVIRAKIADNYTGVKDLEREIELRKELAKELRKKADNTAMVESGKKAAAETLAEWKRGWEETDRIARDVFTSWATDGGNAAQKIGDTLKKALLSAIYEATLKPLVMQVYTSVVGSPAGAAGVGSVAGLGSKVLDWITGGSGPAASGGNVDKSILFGTGYGTTGAEAAGGAFGGFGGAGAMVGKALPWIGAALLVKDLMSYKIDAKGNGITATVGGANGLPSGKVGTYSEFQQTGGLGGGGVTTNRDWGVADQGVADYITGNVQAITASNKAYASSLGLTSEKIDAFTKNIEVNTTGLDAAGQKAAIDAALSTFAAEQAAAAYGDALDGVARKGETTTQTLQRLGTDLTGVNAMFGSLGYTLYDVSVAGASAASTLVSAFGDLATAQSQMGSFYQNFYSQGEQEANTYRTVQADLEKAGISYTIDQLRAANRTDIRAAVDGLSGDTITEQGAARYAAAVRAANTLAGVKAATGATTPAATVQQVGSSGGGGGGGGGSAGDTAAASIASAWQQITDSIFSEVKRIRGLIEGTGEDAFAAAQTRFSIATAQARAGDQAAATALPELSQNLLTLGETNAQTLLQLRILQGQTAASLTTTGSILSAGFGLTVPSVDVAATPIPQASTQAYTPAYNPVLSSSSAGNDSATAAALRALADRLDLIEANTRAGAQHGGALSRQITRLVPGGDALEVRVVV